MRSVINRWTSAAKRSLADAESHSARKVVAEATRGKLADSSSCSEEEPDTPRHSDPDDSQSNVYNTRHQAKQWLQVKVHPDAEDMLWVYIGHKCVLVEVNGQTLATVLAAMHHERRCIRASASPGESSAEHESDFTSRVAYNILGEADVGRITWSYSQKAFAIHYRGDPSNPRRHWKKIPVGTPIGPDATWDEAEKALELALTVARFKWNEVDKSDDQRYERD